MKVVNVIAVECDRKSCSEILTLAEKPDTDAQATAMLKAHGWFTFAFSGVAGSKTFHVCPKCAKRLNSFMTSERKIREVTVDAHPIEPLKAAPTPPKK